MEDECSEATIPEPFTTEEEADDTQTTQVAAATPERSLEAILEHPTKLKNNLLPPSHLKNTLSSM